MNTLPFERARAALRDAHFIDRLWKKDPSLWGDRYSTHELADLLAWTDLPQRMLESVGRIEEFARAVKPRFDHVALLGMGGSSLPAEVIYDAIGGAEGYPSLHILDSTHPAQIKALETQIELDRALFIVASKRGATIEPNACYAYFYERVGRADQFAAITDPGTPLALEAKKKQFLECFENDPRISGRYSAFSYFGLVPAAIAGSDVRRLLQRAVNPKENGALATSIAAAIAGCAEEGRNKLTVLAEPRLSSLGEWIEQQVAECTAKLGKGVITVSGEPLGDASVYNDDRSFVNVSYAGHESAEKALEQLEAAGHPVMRIAIGDPYEIGPQLFTWEIASVMAAWLIAQDPFPEPDVEASTIATKALLKSRLPDQSAVPNESIEKGLALIGKGDYVSIGAYLPRTEENEALLRQLRTKIRDRYRVATVAGFGPRFLHLTEQLHKGGPNASVTLQIVDANAQKLSIPDQHLIEGGTLRRGKAIDFASLLRAQALGDRYAREERGRRGVTLQLKGDISAGLRSLIDCV